MSLLRSLHTSPNTGVGSIPNWRAEGPTRACPTVASIAIGISVDTGTLERVANWSRDSVATVDPCDPGTDPRNGPFAGIPHGDSFLTLTSTVTCPRLWWYAATCPTRWSRSGSGHRLLPVGVQRLLFSVVLAVVAFPSSASSTLTEQGSFVHISFSIPRRACWISALSYATERAKRLEDHFVLTWGMAPLVPRCHRGHRHLLLNKDNSFADALESIAEFKDLCVL